MASSEAHLPGGLRLPYQASAGRRRTRQWSTAPAGDVDVEEGQGSKVPILLVTAWLMIGLGQVCLRVVG